MNKPTKEDIERYKTLDMLRGSSNSELFMRTFRASDEELELIKAMLEEEDSDFKSLPEVVKEMRFKFEKQKPRKAS